MTLGGAIAIYIAYIIVSMLIFSILSKIDVINDAAHGIFENPFKVNTPAKIVAFIFCHAIWALGMLKFICDKFNASEIPQKIRNFFNKELW